MNLKKIYVLNEWISQSKKNVFIFAGEEKVNKTDYSDSKTNDITIIDQYVYDTDTIETVRYKIAHYCLKNKNVKTLYLWADCDINNEERILFKQSLFKTNVKLTKIYINRIVELYFGKTMYKNDLDKMEVVEDFSNEFDHDTITRSLDFGYSDLNDFEEFFSPNPFEAHKETDDKSIKRSYLKNLLYRFRLKNNIIHFVCNNTTTTINEFYFQNTTTYNENYVKMITNKMDIQKKLETNETYMDTMNNRIEYLLFRALPYSHDITINMKTLFKISHTSYTIPFIVYKSKFTNEYKVNKLALTDMDKRLIDSLNTQEMKNQQNVINRSNDTIIYYIKFNESTFFNLLLSENGSYRLKYKFTKTNDIKMVDIKQSFEKINDVYKNLEEYMIYKLTEESELFSSKMIEIIEYNTQNTITFKKKISENKFVENIKMNNPFFVYDKNIKNSIHQFQFVDINNFYNTDAISAFIYRHLGLSKNDMIDKLQYYFNMDEDEASDAYIEKKNNINLKASRKGKNIFAVRDYHTAVTVKINILSDSSIKINTTNTQDDKYRFIIIYYVINMLNSKLKKSKASKVEVITEEVSVVEDESSETVNFNDLIDSDNSLDDLDLDDLSDIDMSSPKVNIETDINDYDEENEDDEDEEDDEEEEEIEPNDNDSGKHTDYTTFVLNKLYTADKNLFLWDKKKYPQFKAYSSKCQKTDFKQPIVINKKEKDKIDKEHPDSYTGYVQTGSTTKLKDKNFYICPKIWCRVGRVSITEKEYESYGKKCPHGEEAMFFPEYGTRDEDNYFMTAKNGEQHWPSLMKNNKHPKGLHLPCCGKKNTLEPENKDNNKKKQQNSNYISNISSELPLDQGTYGNLPYLMNKIMNKKAVCNGIMKSKSSCYVRTGVDKSKDGLFETLKTVLNIESLGEYIGEHMKLEHYIFLNGGNTLKVFMNNEMQYKLAEQKEFDTFKMYFLNNKKYIEMFNLREVVNYIKSKKEFEIKNDLMTKMVIREYLILNSFINFKNYIIQDNIEKHIDDVYHMLTYEWLNPNKINFIFLNVHKEDVYFMNPKYYSYKSKYNNAGANVVILNIANSYEYVSKISQKPKTKNEEIMFKYVEVKPILQNIEEELKDDKYDSLIFDKNVSTYILSLNMKCIGVIIDEHVIYLENEIMLEYDNIKKKRVVYADAIDKYTVSEEYMKKYNKRITQQKIKELQVNKNTNLSLFVQDPNQSFKEDSVEKKYNDNLYNVTKKIMNKSKLLNAVNVLNSSLNNFTMVERVYLLKQILKQNKVKYDEDIDEAQLITDVLRIPLNRIIDDYKIKVNIKSKNDIYMTYEDILNQKIFEYYNKYNKSFFTVIDTSIEDFVDEINYIKMDDLDDANKEKNVVWSNLRKPVKPVSIERMFPNFVVIDEEITYNVLINYGNDLDRSFTLESFEEKLNQTIIDHYMEDKDSLYDNYSENKNFETHKFKKSKINVDDYTGLIKKDDYYYSIFELKLLAKILNYNLIIIGRSTQLIEHGVMVVNNQAKNCLVLQYNILPNRHSFNLVVKDDNPYRLITKNDFLPETNKLLKLI